MLVAGLLVALRVGACPDEFPHHAVTQNIGLVSAFCCASETCFQNGDNLNAFYRLETLGKNSRDDLCLPATKELPCCYSLYYSNLDQITTDKLTGAGMPVCVASDNFNFQSPSYEFNELADLIKCEASVYHIERADEDGVSYVSSVNCFPPADEPGPLTTGEILATGFGSAAGAGILVYAGYRYKKNQAAAAGTASAAASAEGLLSSAFM